MRPKDADGIANSVDPDQTAPKEQSDLGLHCLLSSIFPNTRKIPMSMSLNRPASCTGPVSNFHSYAIIRKSATYPEFILRLFYSLLWVL